MLDRTFDTSSLHNLDIPYTGNDSVIYLEGDAHSAHSDQGPCPPQKLEGILTRILSPL